MRYSLKNKKQISLKKLVKKNLKHKGGSSSSLSSGSSNGFYDGFCDGGKISQCAHVVGSNKCGGKRKNNKRKVYKKHTGGNQQTSSTQQNPFYTGFCDNGKLSQCINMSGLNQNCGGNKSKKNLKKKLKNHLGGNQQNSSTQQNPFYTGFCDNGKLSQCINMSGLNQNCGGKSKKNKRLSKKNRKSSRKNKRSLSKKN
tara:strand:+ start:2516 stop:3109 length:594 start_codon:yes stop_codon:yes gene_type:complete